MNVCTIVCRNYIAQARVFARSFAEHYPERACVVLVLDAADAADYAAEGFHVVVAGDLGIPDFDVMAGIYEPIELSTAVKPWLLEWMDRRYGADGPVAYFDPDIRIASRLVELEAMLEDHWAVLTPHFTQPLPLDGESPSEQAILLAGTYNLGFIALRRAPQLEPFLAWWQERLARLCRVDQENGFFVDQRFIDFLPGLFDGVGVLRHDGYNVAYWNLATRHVESLGEGMTVNGSPLRFFHFSGFDPRRATEVSRHQTRVSLASSPALAELFKTYAQDLEREGYLEAVGQDYGFGMSASGHPLSTIIRRIYDAAVADGFRGSLFDEQGDREFTRLLRTPTEENAQILTGYAYLWRVTPAVQDQYPDYLRGDCAEFLNWCAREQAAERLLAGYVQSSPRARYRGSRRRIHGVNVVGYLNAESGVGEAARGAISLLDEVSVPVWPLSIEAPGVPNEVEFRTPGGPPDLPFDNSLVCINADMLPHHGPALSRAGLMQTSVTGLWWWETEQLPTRFDRAFSWVDQVVAGSTFVRDSVARVGRVPVKAFPLPVEVGPVADRVPDEIRWPTGFVFYFSFDYASVFRRKNPDGLVSAYMRAFAPDEGAGLVIKSINADKDPANHRMLMDLVDKRDDIVLFDGFVAEADRNALTANCDCYVSLHRSEGFGLTIAEAMYLGRPVIATAYSGNMDFMSPDNSLPVSYHRVEIGNGAGPYGPGGEWAEPDLDDAIGKMRRVFQDRELARFLGESGARSIRETHSRSHGAKALARTITGESDE